MLDSFQQVAESTNGVCKSAKFKKRIISEIL